MLPGSILLRAKPMYRCVLASTGMAGTKGPVSASSGHSRVHSKGLGKAAGRVTLQSKALQWQVGSVVKQSTWKTPVFVFKLSPFRHMIILMEWCLE